MPNQPVSRIKINLNRKAKEKLENVFYKWAINVGRMLILITELVALGALFYRFVIDRQIIDLNEIIKEQQSFVQAQASQEQEYRSIQDRLATVKNVKTETEMKVKVMNDILNAVNENTFTSSSLSIDDNVITVDGSTPSILLLYEFINHIREYPEVQKIGGGQINSSEQGVLFKLSIELKKNEPPTGETLPTNNL